MKIKVSQVLNIWDQLIKIKDIGDLNYTDFEKVIDEVVGVENNMTNHPPLSQLTEEEIEALEDEADLRAIKERRDEQGIPLEGVKKQLGLD